MAKSSSMRATMVITATVSGCAMALMCFLLLPLLRAITSPERPDVTLRDAGTIDIPQPPRVDEPEPEKQDDEPPPPEIAQAAPQLDLSQLELVLTGGFGAGTGAGDFVLPLDMSSAQGGLGADELFDFASLEEQPRVIFRTRPHITREMEKRMPCTVYILLTVTADGTVENPTIHSSDDPIFDAAALQAIRSWKFEPGKRSGKPDSFRVRQPITFK